MTSPTPAPGSPQSTPKLLVHGAVLLHPTDTSMTALRDAWLLVDADGRVGATGTGTPPAVPSATEVLDAAGRFLAPGFVSAHSHLFTSGVRGRGADQTLYGWCSEMFAPMAQATPEDMYWFTLHGSLDFLAAGVTTAYDFTDTRLPFDPLVDGQRATVGALRPLEHLTRQFDAKVDAGLRFVHSVGLDDSVGTEDEVLDRLRDVVTHAAAAASQLHARTSISGAVQWSTTPATAALEARAMAAFGLLNQPHFLETREHLAQQHEKFAWYADSGALGPDLVFGHFVQPTAEMIAAAGAAGCGVSWQPVSNGRLASGVADVPAWREAGMRIGIGLDDQACTDLADPFQSMRMGLYLLRAATGDPTTLSVGEILRMHTVGGAEALGITDQVGGLAPGQFADFVLVDPTTPDTGPIWDPIATYVLACGLRNLVEVRVAGDSVWRDGTSTNPLAPVASAQIRTRLERLNPGQAWA